MSPEPDFQIFSKLLDWGWAAVAGLLGLVYKAHNEKFRSHDEEIGRQRDNIAKIFDKLETHAQRSEDRHHELLHALHAGLDRKADK